MPLELGHRVYARHLGFPSSSSLGSSIASRVSWFSAGDRLPVARNILQRWSVGQGAGHGLPDFQWLSNFAVARGNTTGTSLRSHPAVHSSASPRGAEVNAGETHEPPPGDLSRSAVSTASSGNLGSLRAVGASVIFDPQMQQATPSILPSTDEGTVNKATPSANDDASSTKSTFGSTAASAASVTAHSPMEKAAPSIVRSTYERTLRQKAIPLADDNTSSTKAIPAVNTDPEGSRSGGTVSTTDAAPVNRAIVATSIAKAALQASSQGGTPSVLRSIQEKSRGTQVRSTISESFNRALSQKPILRKSDESPVQRETASATPSGHDLPLRVASPSPRTGLPGKVNDNELAHVEPAVEYGNPAVNLDAGHQHQTQAQQSTLRAAEPTQVGATYVGPPIFRRSLGGRPGRTLSANVSRSQDGSHESGTTAGLDGMHATLPGALHTEERRESPLRKLPREEQTVTLPRINAHPLALTADNPGPEYNDRNNKIETSSSNNSAINNSTGTAQDIRRDADQGSHTLSRLKLDSGVTHSELITHVLPAQAGIERSIESSVSNMAGEAQSAQVPSRLHTHLSLSPDGPQSATGEHTSLPTRLEYASPSRSTTGESMSLPVQSPSSSASTEGKPALSSRPTPTLQSLGRTFPLSAPNSASPLAQRLHDSTTNQFEPQTSLRPGGVALQPMGPQRPVPMVPLGTLSKQNAVRGGQLGEPSGDSQIVTHLIPKVSSASAGTGPAQESSAEGTMTDAMTVARAKQAENLSIPSANSDTTFAATVLRSAESGSPRADVEIAGPALDPAGDSTIHGARIRIEQSPARLHPMTPGPTPSAARRVEASFLRQPPLPAALPRLNRASVIPTLHPFAAVSLSGDAVNNSSRISTLTHRAVYAVDQLQRDSEPAFAVSSSRDTRNFHPLVARDATGAMQSGVPTLPTVSSAASGTPQGLRNAEVTQLANRVYELLVRRLDSERQRRGQ